MTTDIDSLRIQTYNNDVNNANFTREVQAMVVPLTITVSENAAKHVRDFTGKKETDAVSLRVGVKGGGCSGLTYDLSVDSASRPEDKVIEQHGVTILIDKKSYVFLAGTTLDYSGGLNGKGFVFHNPNAKTTCGCGTSFSV